MQKDKGSRRFWWSAIPAAIFTFLGMMGIQSLPSIQKNAETEGGPINSVIEAPGVSVLEPKSSSEANIKREEEGSIDTGYLSSGTTVMIVASRGDVEGLNIEIKKF